MKKVVLDTSVIINGQISKEVESGILKDLEIIIPVAVIDELQSQASQKKEQGFLGLEEIKKLNTDYGDTTGVIQECLEGMAELLISIRDNVNDEFNPVDVKGIRQSILFFEKEFKDD